MGRRNHPHDIFKYIDLRGPDECWPWKGSVSSKGIPYFSLDGKKVIAYRLVYMLTHPEWDMENSREVLRHQCKDAEGRAIDNPLCCNPSHVIPGTHLENMLDMVLRSRSGLTKAMVYDILNISQEHPDMTHSQIASRVSYKHQANCSRQAVTDILNGNRHRELKNALDAEQRAIEESGKKAAEAVERSLATNSSSVEENK